jgi:hypothetical protein
MPLIPAVAAMTLLMMLLRMYRLSLKHVEKQVVLWFSIDLRKPAACLKNYRIVPF